jgi:hypothetical protein
MADSPKVVSSGERWHLGKVQSLLQSNFYLSEINEYIHHQERSRFAEWRGAGTSDSMPGPGRWV